MQQIGQSAEVDGTERKRVEAVVETLATLRTSGESLAEVAHDARNMVTALGLYCDLLEEPGVLAAPFLHYGGELRLVAAASRRLVEKLMALDSREAPASASAGGALRGREGLPPEEAPGGIGQNRRWDLLPAEAIQNLAGELLASRNLLAALAGPSIVLTIDAQGGARPVSLTGENLTRVLVNLVKNAAEAMPGGGRIHLALCESAGEPDTGPWLTLTVEDNGPGIARNTLDRVFEPGYTTHRKAVESSGVWPATHRGLGLSISRSIVEAAGGRIRAENRPQAGARFVIGLPVRTL
jgi:signal transduction histidine kinase